ncbi:hypothetical protein KR018_005337 [Drosophila ironensis]|nr:hypothetical protein KR018_005337 [Drosophila ironensis]
METDGDLTTNEPMPTLAELELPKPKARPKKEPRELVEEPQPKKETLGNNEDVVLTKPAEQRPVKPPVSLTVIKVEEGNCKDKPEPEPTPRPCKITRSSLNGTANQSGARSPTIIKRLRKSTRFKGKQAGAGKVNGSHAGIAGPAKPHNSSPNMASASSTHLSGAGNHPSNSNKHGKSVAGGGSGAVTARNRRNLFKKPAQKTPKVQASTRFVQSVFFKGSYMQIGDIVSIVDGEQNLYYAQIRGLLVDAYCEKSAFLTWLIPTQDSPDPQDGFDPATYLIGMSLLQGRFYFHTKGSHILAGPDEELSRKLCYLEFVMHAPSNYYYDRNTPFPLPDVDEYRAQRSDGFIWTRLPVVKRYRERERSGNRAGGATS